MEELRKIARIVNREATDAKVETILVLDAGLLAKMLFPKPGFLVK